MAEKPTYEALEQRIKELEKDAAKHKKTEDALRESEEKLRVLFENSYDLISLIDANVKTLWANPAWRKVFGPETEYNDDVFTNIHPDDREKAAKSWQDLISDTATIKNIQYNYKMPNGVYSTFESSAFPVVIGKEKLYYVIARDITDRKRVEEERKKLEAQLVYAQKMEAIGTLAGGIAHNFNNILGIIMGNTELIMLDANPDDLNYRNLETIKSEVLRGSRLTGQLLGYARKGKYEVQSISLNKVVEETSTTFGEARKEIVVHRELADNLFGIQADKGQIEQILLNLYVNAADVMPAGGDLFLKTVNLTHEDMRDKPYKPKPGNYVLVTVRDTGIGMDKETMERIFDPFFTTKGLAESTGLGLASTYGIIKAHGGYIDVDSQKGHGTTFSIYLPATEEEIPEERELTGELVKGKGTILLVDDEKSVLDTGERMLNRLGYEVLLAGGGQEALEIYEEKQDKIDMVLLDMIMPRMGGGKTYDRMKEVNPEIKILLVSGYDIEGQATEILERGCDGFIQKPFDMKELSQKIREILDKE